MAEPATQFRESSADRELMVANQLARRGISDKRVLAAFRAVPRESFVPAPT